jgi:acetyl esterase/lipase
LRAFDTVMPKDGASRLVAADVPYGEGPRRQLDVYAPVAGAHRPLPVIVFIYGGSWANGTREGYHFAARALSAAGFVTVVPDYRLVPEVRFPGFVQDCAAAVRWVRAHGRPFGGRLQCRDARARPAIPGSRPRRDQGFRRARRPL